MLEDKFQNISEAFGRATEDRKKFGSNLNLLRSHFTIQSNEITAAVADISEALRDETPRPAKAPDSIFKIELNIGGFYGKNSRQ